ncbi:hypothetical protein ASPACDRAFT_44044 [Aspergillus aculeatus ATCC 16872]|uniref:Uncharacterized protein n=1 Tax=Aspergillus aculeatus (strain ATCC 16872 / CBS 172.66 / WB 5094) TaxID=690307 RepID=A0A1L9WT71_ASPA1|nr:uncharacterized protein ASPACDRAFT_44044 [Aspergillus aculeatus ATCC 16872]OJJ99381.1 hypothetical protein ASPACDRAFT_44044 [Aspergillus aculeatus ATCC 16872]
MQVAGILSDLTSLRVCDYNDALALVTIQERLDSHPAEKQSQPSNREETPALQQEKDQLRQAKELVELHHDVKARHASGTVDEGLANLRQDVQRVLLELRPRATLPE